MGFLKMNKRGALIEGIAMAFVAIVLMGVFLEPITTFVEIGVNGTNSTLVSTIINLFPVLFVIGGIVLIFNLITGGTTPRYNGGY